MSNAIASWPKWGIAAAVALAALAMLMGSQATASHGGCDVTLSPGESIRGATDTASPSTTICLNDGEYDEGSSSWTIDTSLTLRGLNGSDNVTIDRSAASGTRGVVVTADDVTLEGFTLEGPQPAGPVEYGVKAEFVSGLTLNDLAVVESGRSGIDLHGVDGATLTDVATINNAAVGFAITDSHNVLVSGLETSGNSWGGAAIFTSGGFTTAGVSNIDLTSSSFVNEPVGIYLQDTGETDSSGFQDISIDGSAFQDNAAQIAQIDSSGSPEDLGLDLGVILGDNTFDRAVVVRDNPIVVPAIFSSIQDGVDAASAGNTVEVSAGTYAEDLEVNSDLTIRGVDPSDRPVLEGMITNGPSSNPEDPLTDLTIKDIVVQNDPYLVHWYYDSANPGVRIDGVVFDGVDFVLTGSSGPDSTISQAGDANVSLSGDGYTFRNSRFDSQGHSINNHFVWIPAGGTSGPVVLENNEMDGGGVGLSVNISNVAGGLTVVGNHTHDGGSFYLSGSSDVTVAENTFEHVGVTLNGLDGADVYNNDFVDTENRKTLWVSANWGPVGNEDIAVYDNVFQNAETAVKVFDYADPANEDEFLSIFENDFSGVTDTGVKNEFSEFAVDASANWWGTTDPASVSSLVSGRVDFTPLLHGGQATSPGFDADLSEVTVHTLGEQLGSADRIQEGVDLVDGSTVNVAPGTYAENVTIDKDVTLLSTDGRAVTTIDGDPSFGSELGTVFVTNNTSGVQIGDVGHGFTILGIDGPPGLEKAAVYFQGAHSDAIVRGNEITARGDAGLQTLWGATTTSFSVTDNVFSGKTFVGDKPGGEGFDNQFTEPNVPRQLVVLGQGGNAADMTFSDNQITGVAGGTNPDGDEQGNTLVTVDATGSTITGNVFDGSTTRFAASLRVRFPDAVVTGNDFNGSSPVGIYVGEKEAGAPSTMSVHQNNIVGHDLGGISNGGSSTLDATCNWWGAADGPGGNGPGSGDSVSSGVDFQPWLVAPAPDGTCTGPDDEGPITSDVVADPNPAPVATPIDLNAIVDDTSTGGSDIATSTYEVIDDKGNVVEAGDLAPSDGQFDSPTEGVETSIGPFGAPAVFDVCVSGTDIAGNTGPEECILLAVYDPDGGFVTGGGWIDSPTGALGAFLDGEPLLPPFTQDELDNNWEADRQFPSDGVTSTSDFGRDNVARIGIDSAETESNTFRRTEGIKTKEPRDFGNTVQVDLYVDPDWQDKAVRAGFWVVGDDGDDNRDGWYGIIEFVNLEPSTSGDSAQGDHEGWRIWDSANGWTNLPTDFTYGEWTTLEIELDTNAEEYNFFINGDLVGSGPAGEHFIRELFLNSYNYGEDDFPTLSNERYAAHWHAGGSSEVAGKANFGFVSKYKKGADEPTGNTQFRFKAADLNFHSSDYEWLVVAGDTAKFKGTGTVNGDTAPNGEPFKFKLWAGDDDPDTFRIKIWWEDSNGDEVVVYDNGMNQPIGGGSIQVHDK